MNDQFPNTYDVESLAAELSSVIRLEECNPTPARMESVSDYEVNALFVELLKEFPDLLNTVLQGQRRAREIKTYSPPSGILDYETTGHASFLRTAMRSIQSLLEFKIYLLDRTRYVNPVSLGIFLFNYRKVLQNTGAEADEENTLWLKIAERIGVTDTTIAQMQEYLKKSHRNLGLQEGSAFERQDRALAAEPKYEA